MTPKQTKPVSQVEKFNVPKAEITKLLKESENLVISDTKSLVSAKGKGTKVQRVITAIEQKRKELKAPILEQAKQIDEIAKELSKPLEVRKLEIKATVAAYEQKKAEERAEKERIKQAKLDAIREKITQWRASYVYKPVTTITEIQEKILEVKAKEFSKKEFGELIPEAERERGWLLANMEADLKRREDEEIERKAEEARLLAEKAEREARELEQAKESYNDVFAIYPPEGMPIEQIRQATKDKIAALKAELEKPEEIIQIPQPPIVSAPIPKQEPKKEAVIEVEEVIDPKEENDKALIADHINSVLIDLGENGLFSNAPKLESTYWSMLYRGFQVGLTEAIIDRLNEMLEQVNQ